MMKFHIVPIQFLIDRFSSYSKFGKKNVHDIHNLEKNMPMYHQMLINF